MPASINELVADWPASKKKKFFTLLTLQRAKKRKVLWEKNGGKCHYCKRLVHLPVEGEHKQKNLGSLATLDHIIPASHCGSEHITNFVIACMPCNGSRNDMDFEEYFYLRTTPGAWAAFKQERELERKARKAIQKESRTFRKQARNNGIIIHDNTSMEELVSMDNAPRYGIAKHNWDMALQKYVGHNGINLLINWINTATWVQTLP